MNPDLGCVRGRTTWRCCLVLLATVLFGSLSAWTLPAKGTLAPPLQFTQLLQAPAGAQTNWAALHGKVVVLEFWATWCAPCVAAVPHWNKLAASLDPARFQFISVDDKEDSKVVQGFLTKRKMAGWAGVDTTGKVVTPYGVKSIPTTVIVDGQGRIVSVTLPQNIQAVDLLAIAAGKSVKFKPMTDVSAEPFVRAASPASAVKPLYEVSLIRAAAKEGGRMSAGPGRMDMYGWDSEALLRMAYNNIPKDRLVLKNPLPEGLYNLHVVWASADDNGALMTSFLQPVVTFGFNLHVEPKTVTKTVYVLQATKASRKLLTPTAVTGEGSATGYGNGRLQLVNGSMDELAKGLEAGLDVPVVNETGIQGKFDEELDFPEKDGNAARAALMKVLGLKLIQEDRPIPMLVVESREDAKKTTQEQAPKK